MPRFDRYLLSQLLGLFGFFSLVLVAVYWVNRAVGLFDQLIGDGQSAVVFLEFSLLSLPNVIRLVLPVSAFAACVYAVNRLMQESELVVMQATGFSAFRLARPVLYFGLIVVAMQLVLLNHLVPLSQARLADRSAEVSENITGRFLNEGRFMHPAKGVTLYIREISPLGELNDLFLSDERNPAERVVYTARKALIVRGDTAPRLVMLDGAAQSLSRDDSRRIALTRFSTFAMDLSGIVAPSEGRARRMRELTTLDLIQADPAQIEAAGETPERFRAEIHSRIAGAFLGLAAPLLGFAALMLGGYSRFGLWRQIAVAIVLLIGLQLVNTAATGALLREDGLWPLTYAAPLLGCVLSVLLLWLAQRPRRLRPAPASVAEAAA